MPLSSKARRIFFADDDPDDHYLFITALKELDHTIDIVQFYKCDQILEFLMNDELPDLIFLDFNMPGNEELKCLFEIKQHEKCKDVKVIIYTTSHRNDLVQKAYDIGASRYIVKPSSIRELQVLLREIIIEPDN
jgi:CheY-like chemotaxis protein